MGSLNKYSMRSIPCNIFIETGTGRGASLKHASMAGVFDNLYSVEISKLSAELAQGAFIKYPRVKIFNSSSEAGLLEIFKLIKPNDRIFFFLDAHFPGEFSNDFSGYAGTEVSDLVLPLERELTLIKENRDKGEDIIVIDDLRLYENGPYESGNLEEGFANIPSAMRNIDFVYRLFGDRNVVRSYRDEGYLLIIPRAVNFNLIPLTFLEKVRISLRRLLY